MSLADQNVLQNNTTFQGRVAASMVAAAIAIAGEAPTAGAGGAWLHRVRANLGAQILAGPAAFQLLFAESVATDPSVIGDATVGGTVILTTANVAAQQLLVTDAHINAAVSGQWNAFLTLP